MYFFNLKTKFSCKNEVNKIFYLSIYPFIYLELDDSG